MPTIEHIEHFARELAEAGAVVVRCRPEELSQTVIGLIAQHGWDRVVSVRRNRVGHPSVLGDDPQLATETLASVQGVITESAAGVADGGLVVLDHGPGQGRPGLTLIPLHHLCVVEADHVVASLSDVEGNDGPITLVGGPDGPEQHQSVPIHRPLAMTVVLVV